MYSLKISHESTSLISCTLKKTLLRKVYSVLKQILTKIQINKVKTRYLSHKYLLDKSLQQTFLMQTQKSIYLVIKINKSKIQSRINLQFQFLISPLLKKNPKVHLKTKKLLMNLCLQFKRNHKFRKLKFNKEKT